MVQACVLAQLLSHIDVQRSHGGLAGLFRKLERAEEERKEVGVVGYQISPVSLESLFLHMVRRAQSEAARDEVGAHHHHD